MCIEILTIDRLSAMIRNDGGHICFTQHSEFSEISHRMVSVGEYEIDILEIVDRECRFITQ